MRRRPPPLLDSLPAELVDPRLWPLCARWDSKTPQPCSCWWVQKQTEFLESGGQWPGGESRELTDLLDVVRGPYECRQPWDPSAI